MTVRPDFPSAKPPAAAEPPAEVDVEAPENLEELAELLAAATQQRRKLLVWGGGTHQGIGYPIQPDLVVSTRLLRRVLVWEPDDLTLVVEAGARIADVEAMLAERKQTAVLPEVPGDATVGGVIAAGISGYRRARYGPTRDRVLEVTLVTGDGRVVRGGGRVVKNVSGYDLPRLVTGSLGALGVVAAVCLKLWPARSARLTVRVEDPETALRRLYRPLAVLETPAGSFAYLEGVAADIEEQASRVGGDAIPGLAWPGPPAGEVEVSVRVAPTRVRQVISRIPTGWDYVAQHGVGEVTAAGSATDLDAILDLRGWVESEDGWLVITRPPKEGRVDPWGRVPPALDLQRRLVSAFDPAGVVNPGRLPGRL